MVFWSQHWTDLSLLIRDQGAYHYSWCISAVGLMPATGSVIDVKTAGPFRSPGPGHARWSRFPDIIDHGSTAVVLRVWTTAVTAGNRRRWQGQRNSAAGAGCTVEGLAVINPARAGCGDQGSGQRHLRQVWITQNRRGILVQSAEGCKFFGAG